MTKKFSLLIISILVLLLASCNMDASEGLYKQISTSTINTTVKTLSYLGNINSSYYYLSDDGVYKIGSSEAIISNTNGSIIRSASLDEKSLYIFTQESDRLNKIKYCDDITNPNFTFSDITSNKKLSGITVNGLAYDDKNLYNLENGLIGSTSILPPSVKKIIYIRETNNYAFVSVVNNDNKNEYFVVNTTTTPVLVSPAIEGNNTVYSIFQPLSDNNYLLGDSENIYLLSGSSIQKKCSLATTISNSSSTQAPSFEHEHFVYVKCDGYFDKIDTSTWTVEPVSSDFADNIRRAEISNIIKLDTNTFIASTFESMLYKIDMKSNTSTKL